jgi:hypothetical protein
LVALKDAMVADGMPDTLGNTMAALVHAVCWYVSDGRVAVMTDWDTPAYPTGVTLAAAVDTPLSASGDAMTGAQALAWLYHFSPFRVCYAADGALEIWGGEARRDSGWVLACTPVSDGGPLTVPWEKLTPHLEQPQYTSAAFWYVWEEGIQSPPVGGTGTIFGESGGGGGAVGPPIIHHELLAEASSTHPRFPDSGPYAQRKGFRDRAMGSAITAQKIVDAFVAQQLAGADKLTIELDNAIPAPPLGDEVRVYDPPRADGWYAVTQVTQPLGLGAQSWQLEWRGVA